MKESKWERKSQDSQLVFNQRKTRNDIFKHTETPQKYGNFGPLTVNKASLDA